MSRWYRCALVAFVLLPIEGMEAANPAQPKTVEERIRLIEAMRKCWERQALNQSELSGKGGGELAANVEGAFKRLLSLAASTKVDVDIRGSTRQEFAPFASSEATLVIRACYQAAFGEPLEAKPTSSEKPGSVPTTTPAAKVSSPAKPAGTRPAAVPSGAVKREAASSAGQPSKSSPPEAAPQGGGISVTATGPGSAAIGTMSGGSISIGVPEKREPRGSQAEAR